MTQGSSTACSGLAWASIRECPAIEFREPLIGYGCTTTSVTNLSGALCSGQVCVSAPLHDAWNRWESVAGMHLRHRRLIPPTTAWQAGAMNLRKSQTPI
jgi:hypothetical protein